MKIAILADVHANICALEAVINDCTRQSVEHFLVAGDLVGYYYWPHEVVQRLMSDSRITCIRGNHEDMLSEAIRNDAAAKRYRQKYGSGFDVCRSLMSDTEMRWLLNLPANVQLSLGGVQFSVHHGSPEAIDEYVYPDSSAEDLARCYTDAYCTILGHTHHPFMHHDSSRILLNPGSVGQPRDLGGYASFATFDTANGAVQFKRVPFDTNVIIDAVKAKDPKLQYLQKIMTRGLA